MQFAELDSTVTLAEQLEEDGGPIVFMNILTIDPADSGRLLEAWATDARVMKSAPGFISTQLYRGIAGSGTFINHAVWESTAHYRAARLNSEARAEARALYPDSLVAHPHILRPEAVAGICIA